MSEAAVCQASRRIMLRAKEDEGVKDLMSKVEQELGLLRVET